MVDRCRLLVDRCEGSVRSRRFHHNSYRQQHSIQTAARPQTSELWSATTCRRFLFPALPANRGSRDRESTVYVISCCKRLQSLNFCQIESSAAFVEPELRSETINSDFRNRSEPILCQALPPICRQNLFSAGGRADRGFGLMACRRIARATSPGMVKGTCEDGFSNFQ